ncbi:MAG: HD domain-containing phosphohydrolase [Burkholderiaceae bacterium]
MKVATPPDLIEVDALRVGMFVHLDVGWMSHPFPLSSFRIASDAQMATIRSLGLKRVRWSPQQSDPVEEPAAELQPSGLTGETGVAAPEALADPASDTLAPAASAEAATLTPEAAARVEHVRRLADQRAALVVCERQFTEAAHDCERLTALVPTQPQQAREQAEALTTALLQKMLGEHDLCIRLLSDAAGDKASAHALNVTIISLLMGRSFGLDADDMLELGMGAMLHDIGKILLPERMRHRDDTFSPSEARLYEEHVAHGVTLGRKMGLTDGAMLVIAQHHEHADGSGFPLRLNADRMTAAARIVSLVNRYDNLCNPHLPGRALTPHESLSLLFAQGKNKFDTAILGGFIKMMGVYPAGSTVQLTDDRFAMVVGVNSSRPLKPRVLVHEPAVPREEALVLDLESVAGLGIRRSMKPLQLPAAALEYLAPRPRVAYFFEPTGVEPMAA